MLICKFVFNKGAVPVNPFNLFGYFLYEMVDRDVVRNGNNNIMGRCDELWVFGDISDGMLAEIRMFEGAGKPIKYFDISKLPEKIIPTTLQKLPFEQRVGGKKVTATRRSKDSQFRKKKL